MSDLSMIAKLYRDLYLEYMNRTKSIGLLEYVDPEDFWANVFLPSFVRVQSEKPKVHVHAQIDEHHQLVLSLDGTHIKGGITPRTPDLERSLKCPPSEPVTSTT